MSTSGRDDDASATCPDGDPANQTGPDSDPDRDYDEPDHDEPDPAGEVVACGGMPPGRVTSGDDVIGIGDGATTPDGDVGVSVGDGDVVGLDDHDDRNSAAVPRDPPPPEYARFIDSGVPVVRREVSRRAILRGAFVAAGLAALAFAGQTVPFLRWISFLAPRSGQGPQGVPVNRTASAAGVLDSARAADYTLTITANGNTVQLTLEQLNRMPQYDSDLPIACVEGWSAQAKWRGVRVKDLVQLVGGDPNRDVRFVSLERGLYGVSVLPANFARNPSSLVALQLYGETLSIDHGFPCRLITPNRPGVLQTKWLSRIDVL